MGAYLKPTKQVFVYPVDRPLKQILEIARKENGFLPSFVDVEIPFGSPEWDYMWKAVLEDPLSQDAIELWRGQLDEVLTHPESPEECLLYGTTTVLSMGIYVYPVHHFVHKRHPSTDQREDLYIHASADFVDKYAQEWFN